MYADHAIGVVLSGGDSDGSLGICEIKHAGGFTFAQLPGSARFPNMPQHAIDTGCVDVVLRPNEIAGEIVRLTRGVPRAASDLESASTSATDAGSALRSGDSFTFSSGSARRTEWTSPTTREPRSGGGSSGE